VRRIAALVAAGTLVVAGGTAFALTRTQDRAVPLLAAGTSVDVEQEPTTTTSPSTSAPTTTTATATVVDEPTTTTSTTDPPASPGSAHPHEPHETTTTSTTPAPEPSTTIPPSAEHGDDSHIDLRCSAPEEQRVTCEWTGVPSGADRLVLLRAMRDSGYSQRASIDDETVASYDDGTVMPGTPYHYRLVAQSADGGTVGDSGAVDVTTPGTAPRPAPPSSLHMTCTTPATADDLTVSCDWSGTPAGTARLVVMREAANSGPSQPLWSTDDASVDHHDDASARAGVTYSYRVSAFDADGTSLGTSNPVKVTPGAGGGVA
jgi:hypothetical protein